MAWRRAAALVLALMAAAACSGSRFRYVANQEEQVFFRIPEEWRVFDQAELLADVRGEEAPPSTATSGRMWLLGFDAAPHGEPGDVLEFDRPQPGGVAQVMRLTADERDQVSLPVLRSVGFGFDPVEAARRGQPVEVRQLDDVTLDSGAHGVHLVVAIGEGDDRHVVDQTVLVDAATTRLYRFAVGCLEDCFEEHEQLLGHIARSLTLEAPRS